jgi:hypothetical protein
MQSKMVPWTFALAVPDIDRSSQYFRDVLWFRDPLGGCNGSAIGRKGRCSDHARDLHHRPQPRRRVFDEMAASRSRREKPGVGA